MAKKKSITETIATSIADTVDHVLHPHGHGESSDGGEQAKSPEPSQKSEIEAKMNHPKFDKFKKGT